MVFGKMSPENITIKTLQGQGKKLTGAAPNGSDLSEPGAMLLSEAAEIHQDLLHLLGKHLLEILVPPHELNNDIVPLLDSREVIGVLKGFKVQFNK